MNKITLIFTFYIILPLTLFAQKPELTVPSGQNSWIMSTNVSPDGKFLLSAAMDRSIKIYDLREKKEVFTFWEHADYVTAIDIAPDNKTVVSGDVNGEVVIWDLYRGQLTHRCKLDNRGTITAIDIAPDGKTFLAADRFGYISEYNLASGELIIEEQYHEFAINKIRYIKKGSEFFSSAPDNSVADTLSNLSQTRVSDKTILNSIYLASAVYRSCAFSEDGSTLYYVVKDPNELRIITKNGGLNEGDLLREDVQKIPIVGYTPFDIEIISDDLVVIACQKDKKISFILFNAADSKISKVINTEVLFLEDYPTGNFEMQLLPGSQTKVVYTTGYQGDINCTDLGTGKTELLIPKKTAYQSPLIIEDRLYLGGEDKALKSWYTKDNSIETLRSSPENINKIIPFKEGIITGELHKIIVWEKDFAQMKDSILFSSRIHKLSLSPDSTKIAVTLFDNTLKVYDLIDHKLLETFNANCGFNNNIDWSDNNTIVVICSSNDEANLIHMSLDGSRKTIPLAFDERSRKKPSEFIYDDDLKTCIIAYNGVIESFDNTGKSIIKKQISTGLCFLLRYEPKLRQIIASFENGDIFFLNRHTLAIEKQLHGHKSWTTDITISQDYRKVFSTSYDNTIKIWDYKNGQLISTLFLLDGTEWVVVNEDGLFDASPRAMKDIYYVVNDASDTDDPWKIIEFGQLKHRYYQPDLLQIQLGHKQENLRTPLALREIPLAPKVNTLIKDDQLHLEIKNKKGGIGKVVVFIENAEVISDLRPQGKNDADADSLTLTIDLNTFKNRFRTAKEISLKVVAWNKDEWISSRPVTASYTPLAARGSVGTAVANKQPEETPRLFGLVIGTSDYAGQQIDLNYAAKDASDFANAIRRSSANLFDQKNVFIEVLSSDDADLNKKPTRNNILQALKNLEEKVYPSDILVVYLSGHGVNYGGTDGDFYYLTQEASGADAAYLNDEGIRHSSTLSSTDLTQLLNTITAKKKVLIIDACAAGKAAEKMGGAKDIPASQVRALDRMQDRTGFYILAGSAADAVSYESSVYGQGLLTYSLLKAIKGSALRVDGDEEYIDVQQLFQFAVEEVPNLSKNIGGIQKPLFRSPDNQQSFDIGKVDLNTKNAIEISEPKPVFIEAIFSDSESLYDELGLSETFNANLQEKAVKGKNAEIAFMRVKEYPDAYRVSGTYSQMGDKIKINYIIVRNKKPINPINTIMVSKEIPIEDITREIIDSLAGVGL